MQTKMPAAKMISIPSAVGVALAVLAAPGAAPVNALRLRGGPELSSSEHDGAHKDTVDTAPEVGLDRAVPDAP